MHKITKNGIFSLIMCIFMLISSIALPINSVYANSTDNIKTDFVDVEKFSNIPMKHNNEVDKNDLEEKQGVHQLGGINELIDSIGNINGTDIYDTKIDKAQGNEGRTVSTQKIFSESEHVNNVPQFRNATRGEVKPDVKLSNFIISRLDGGTSGTYYHWDSFNISFDWDATSYSNTLKEGDWFEVTLPNNMNFPSNHDATNFDLLTPGGEIIGKAVVTPNANGGGKIRATFTKYVEDKYDIKGKMQLQASFGKIDYNKTNIFEISINGVVTTLSVYVNGPIELKDDVLAKWAYEVYENESEANWTVRINHKKGTYNNFILKDELYVTNGDLGGMHYIEDSFTLFEVEYDKYGNEKPGSAKKVDISNRLNITDNGTKFTLDLSNLINQKQFKLRYRSTYIPGTILRNKTVGQYDGKTENVSARFKSASSSGSGDGNLTSKIRIRKVDADNNSIMLKGAIFKITKSDGTSFDLTTNEKGEATSQQLIPGTYKIKEVTPPDGYELNKEEYTVSVTSDEATIKTITNKKSKTKVSVKKEWTDGKEEKIKVALLANGQKLKEVELSELNGWKHTFDNLDKYNKDGTEINYTVKEVGEENTLIQFDGKWYKVSITGNMTSGYTITNKELPPLTPMKPPARDIKITKDWKDISGGALEAPVEKIKVELYKDGVATGKKLDLEKSNNWKASFDKLPVYESIQNQTPYNYTIKEIGEENTLIQFDGKWYKVSIVGDMSTGYTITNKKLPPLTPMEPPTRDIKVTKDWKGTSGGALEAPVEKIEVELYKDGVATGKKLDLEKSNNWKASFDKLPVYESIQNQTPYNYTIKEIGEENTLIQFDGKWYKVSIVGDMSTGYTITNKKLPPLTPMEPPTRDIKVTKDWKGTSGGALEAPVEKIEVELYKDGVATGTKKEISKSNDWKANFDNLPVYESIQNQTPYNYTIKEVGEENTLIQFDGKWYKVSIVGDMATGYTITNKKLPPLTPMESPTRDIKVTKDWKDISGGALEAPVEKIEVELYRDGVATGTKKEISKSNNWKVSFDKLPVYESIKNQIPYKYTVKEVGEENTLIQFDGKWYKVSIVGDMATGFAITNKKLPPLTPMEPPTRDIKVTKDWKDTSGGALEAPVEKIEVELYRDGKATGKKLELNKKNNWKAIFDKLPVYESIQNQTPYKYTIKEVGEQNTLIQFDGKWYKVSIVGDMATGYTITNKRTPSEKPSIPSENVPSEKIYVEIKKLPKTGDSQNLSMYSGIFLILGSLLLAGLKREKL